VFGIAVAVDPVFIEILLSPRRYGGTALASGIQLA
jgi:hypothetical protein